MKLINYISRRYVIYAIFILLIAIPVFYFSLQYLMLKSLDENMNHQKTWIKKQLKTTIPDNFISFENSIVVRPSHNPKVFDSIYNEPVFIPDDNETVMHRILLSNTIVNGKAYEIRIQKSMIEDEDLLNSILILQLVLVIILLIGLMIINFRLSKKLWKPFNDIVEKLNLYRVDSNDEYQLMPTHIEEFKNLGISIKDLTKRNQKLYKTQKEFTENASHELQTPIAVIQSKLELLMQTTPLSEEQAELIEGISIAGNKMQRLNRTLLLLTKIENNQFPDTERLKVKSIVQKLLNQYEEPAQQKNIQWKTQLDGEIEVTANPILIDILIGNILSNAIRHSTNGDTVSVKISRQKLIIANPATKELNEKDLFQRFKKQSENTNSIGLGLEMSKKICDLYHYKIQYNFADHQHIFSIYFE
ncbi:sensor histidine kinase [Chryseobacterium lactis]|uniref:histidine kinase n=1 Tax=Chryseobacterium lactis TaxID=1241981 RepID=A0A3G6RQ27_CHRLC|nr:HAMP domain-containing sensor histidine kinase [Chryseobacterium lactis]AZA83739.1 sensor histidine kinase [Chryseobacterium lactis]AZB04124.1 sensor histidine kinase [Chryseobacterium lactis]PNW12968.1 sensor histidine kinase [Chryseobacterium lactis]